MAFGDEGANEGACARPADAAYAPVRRDAHAEAEKLTAGPYQRVSIFIISKNCLGQECQGSGIDNVCKWHQVLSYHILCYLNIENTPWLLRRFKGKFYRTRYPAISFRQGSVSDTVSASSTPGTKSATSPMCFAYPRRRASVLRSG